MKNSVNHSGVQIQEVIGSSFAEAAHFKRGDVIHAVDGQTVHAQADVFALFEKAVKKGVAEVSVVRGDALLNITLSLC